MAIAQFTLPQRDFAMAPIDVVALRAGVVGAPGVAVRGNDATAGEIVTIDDHETAQWRDVRMDVEGDGLFRVEGQLRDFMASHERLRFIARNGSETRGINDLLNGSNRAIRFAGRELYFVSLAFGKG